MYPSPQPLVIVCLISLLGACGSSGADGGDAAPDTGPPDAQFEYEGAIGEIAFAGPWGGAATAIVEDPTTADRLYGIVGEALFRSETSGQLWQELELPGNESVASLLALPDGRLIAGTDDDVFVSSDGGDAWQSIKYDLEQDYSIGVDVTGIAYQPGEPARLWVALAHYGTAPIWSLADGETTWQPWTEPADWADGELDGEARFTSIDTHLDTSTGEVQIFASYALDFGAGGGVFCSTDSGTTFAACSSGLAGAPFHRVRIYDDMIVAAGGIAYNSSFAGIYHSTDDGASWRAANNNWTEPVANDFVRLSDDTWLIATHGKGLLGAASLDESWTALPQFAGMSVGAVAQVSDGTLFAGPEQLGVFVSTDAGDTWTAASTGLSRAAVHDASIDPRSPTTLLAPINSANSGLVMRTTSGIDGWQIVSSLGHPRFSVAHIGESGTWYVVSDGPSTAANDGIWRSEDDGASFEFIGPLRGALMDHDIIDVIERDGGEHLIAGGRYWSVGDYSPFITHSVDGGETWTELWRGTRQHRPTRLVETASGDLFMSIDQDGIVHVSPDGQPRNISIPLAVDDRVNDVAACHSNADRLYAVGATEGGTFAIEAFASSDQGESWVQLGIPFETNEWPKRIAVHPLDCDMLFLTTSKHRLLVSEDAGGTWNELSYEPTISINQLRVVRADAGDSSVLLVAGLGGVVTIELLASPL